jgi:hypothetical protein
MPNQTSTQERGHEPEPGAMRAPPRIRRRQQDDRQRGGAGVSHGLPSGSYDWIQDKAAII